MGSISFKSEISIGDILTFLSITISVIAIWIALKKDRQLKKKEQADKIRHAAGVVIAKQERWIELGIRFFEDILPLITDADIKLFKEQDAADTRDFLWHGLVTIRATSSQRIVDEQIEIAYIDLYGYDPRIQELFTEVTNRFKQIDRDFYLQTLLQTQENVVQLNDEKDEFYSAQLGNVLRQTITSIARQYRIQMSSVLLPFRQEMIKLIKASDDEIVENRVQILAPEIIIPTRESLQNILQKEIESERVA